MNDTSTTSTPSSSSRGSAIDSTCDLSATAATTATAASSNTPRSWNPRMVVATTSSLLRKPVNQGAEERSTRWSFCVLPMKAVSLSSV